MFSSAANDPGQQRISAEEAKQLIREHQNRDASLDSSVTVQALAETLNLPTWQVQQMVGDLRASRQQLGESPMPSATWLKTRLWLWALIAIFVVCVGPCGINALHKVPTGRMWADSPKVNRKYTDGIYDHAPVQLGRQLGLSCTPGFSYLIKYDNVAAAANGDSINYVPVNDDTSDENVAIIQEQYTNSILNGFDRTIKATPPQWLNGEEAAVVKPNYYDSGFADPIDITLKQEAFPYSPSNPASKELHDKLLQDIKDHWDDITG